MNYPFRAQQELCFNFKGMKRTNILKSNINNLSIENIPSLSYWSRRLNSFSAHRYKGGAFKCYCCGHACGPNDGWRFEPTNFCFCKECYNKIKERMTRKRTGSRGWLIYTPMGNKR